MEPDSLVDERQRNESLYKKNFYQTKLTVEIVVMSKTKHR